MSLDKVQLIPRFIVRLRFNPFRVKVGRETMPAAPVGMGLPGGELYWRKIYSLRTFSCWPWVGPHSQVRNWLTVFANEECGAM